MVTSLLLELQRLWWLNRFREKAELLWADAEGSASVVPLVDAKVVNGPRADQAQFFCVSYFFLEDIGLYFERLSEASAPGLQIPK